MTEVELYINGDIWYYVLMVAGIFKDEYNRYWIREKNVLINLNIYLQ